MRSKSVIFLVVIWILFLGACKQEEDPNVKTYTDDDIYIWSYECGYLGRYDIPHSFPIVIETETQLAYAEENYNIYKISDVFEEMVKQYSIEQYTYLITYNEVSSAGHYYHADKVKIGENNIYFGMDKKSHGPKGQDSAAVMGGFMHIAAIPKEYMADCDLSNTNVIFPGE